MSSETPDGQETQRLLQQVQAGDEQALEELLARHRDLICRMVDLRMDRQMRGRVDASDVVQHAQMEIAKRIHDYLQRQPMPFHLWLRQTAYQNLLRLRRQHVEAGCRAVGQEMALPEQSSIMLAQHILASSSRPDKKMIEQEMAQRVHEALAELDETDREILLMRHFEEMDNQEVAQVLELDPKTASKRYGRALLKLRKHLISQGVDDVP